MTIIEPVEPPKSLAKKPDCDDVIVESDHIPELVQERVNSKENKMLLGALLTEINAKRENNEN